GCTCIVAIRDDAKFAVPMVATFLLLSGLTRLGRIVPPVIGALVVGALAIALLGTFDLREPVVFGIAKPNLYWPEFSWAAMVELVLPLTITVLAAQNAQRFTVLEA